MLSFKSSQLRANSGDVFDTVRDMGAVIITHRDRDDMVLLTQEQLWDIAGIKVVTGFEKAQKEKTA